MANKEQDSLPELFIESWIYSSAMSVLAASDGWNTKDSDSSQALKLSVAKGELFELARTQVCDDMSSSRQSFSIFVI